MIKTKVRDLPVLTIHIQDSDKEALNGEAKKLGMQLTTYCRMVLLKSITEVK